MPYPKRSDHHMSSQSRMKGTKVIRSNSDTAWVHPISIARWFVQDTWARHLASSVFRFALFCRPARPVGIATGSERHLSSRKASFLCAAHQAWEGAKGGASFQTIKPNCSCRRRGHPIEHIRARAYLSTSSGISGSGVVRRHFDLIFKSNAWIISIRTMLCSSSSGTPADV
jgi:hypothetical protein